MDNISDEEAKARADRWKVKPLTKSQVKYRTRTLGRAINEMVAITIVDPKDRKEFCDIYGLKNIK